MKRSVLFLASFVFSLGLIASVAHAQGSSFVGSIVPNCGVECDICDFEVLIQNVMRFVVYASVLIATGLFAYAGILMLTGGSNPGQVEKAKSIFTNVIIGFVIILSAWLIVDTVMKTFLKGEGNVGALGPWNDIICPAGFVPATGEVPQGTTGGGGTVTPVPGGGGTSPVSGNEAANRTTLASLPNGGISINNSSCNGLTYQQYRAQNNGAGCTDVGGFTDRTISNLTEIRNECTNCVIQITGGSEAGHQTHSDGNRVDFNDDNPAFNAYVVSPQNPMRCVYEGGSEPHWHCTSR